MTLFWLAGAALALAVLAWLLRPLFRRRIAGAPSRNAANLAVYRDQLRELQADRDAGTLAPEDYERARAELEARLLSDVKEGDSEPARRPGRAAAWAVGAAVPLFAFAVYLAVGNPSAIDPHAQVEAMVERLASRMKQNPEDVEGWKLLGRSYAAMGRYDASAEAYARAAVRAPRDAQLLADFADVLAMARGQSLQGEPEQLVLRALEIEPANLKALALAGTAAFERKDFAGAARIWERMLAHVEPGSEDERSIRQNVAEARSLAGEKTPEVAGGVQGTVTLSAKLKEKAAPDDTVYVFARAAEGPPMPLAVARVRVRDLPYRFRLDDSMAMTPAMKLSSFPRVVVGARVSKSGSATAQPGDLQGASAPVANDATAVAVVIDSLVR